nr:4'-phosphopantetheinyltransferase 8N [uncultured bacterium]
MPVVWRHRTASLALSMDEIHVWRAVLNVKAADLDRLQATLSHDERLRVARFRFLRDRRCFIAARGVLRHILAVYVGCEPAALRFCYSGTGKPALATDVGAPDLRFNLSHSHGLAIYVVARGREVGVDLESIQPRFVEDQIAERFFSAREVSALRALPISTQPEAFFNCWTRKEAFVKAKGLGLTIPLNSFEVSLTPGQPAELLSFHADPSEASRWKLAALVPSPGYIAAIAAEGKEWETRLLEWTAPWT